MIRALPVIAVCALALAVSASATRIVHPRLRVETLEPFAVVGSHFVSGERVTVTVRSNGRNRRSVVASRDGSFVAIFRGFVYDVCSGYLVVATGDRGSHARVRLVPECSPFQPAP
jgi:hypothetical protein